MQFYGDVGTFNRELAMYSNVPLRGNLLPVVQASANEDASVTGPFGYVFPPYAVTERGEGLNEWVSRSAPDLATTIFVLLHVAERLQQLHQAGIAHRDLCAAAHCLRRDKQSPNECPWCC